MSIRLAPGDVIGDGSAPPLDMKGEARRKGVPLFLCSDSTCGVDNLDSLDCRGTLGLWELLKGVEELETACFLGCGEVDIHGAGTSSTSSSSESSSE